MGSTDSSSPDSAVESGPASDASSAVDGHGDAAPSTDGADVEGSLPDSGGDASLSTDGGDAGSTTDGSDAASADAESPDGGD